jgi:Leucine-rich repeat (LRR) protein
MSAADDAYRAAEAAIEEAKRTGAEVLDFSGEAFWALETLPPEIGELDRLRSLVIGNKQVSDLAPLQALTGLKNLQLSNTQVSDLAPLKGLTELQTLWLDGTQISDLEPVRGLMGLQDLWLNRTLVSDLSPLWGLTGLQALRLDGTQVSDLAPLQKLMELQDLSLGRTKVSDVAPLKGLTELQNLWLDGTQVSDLDPMRGLTGLQTLSLDNTRVSDFAPLRGLTGLQDLSLDSTQVSDLGMLMGLIGIRNLSLNSTQVSDLAPLRELTGLQTLSLDSTQVSDLAPLQGLTGLQGLSLDGTQVSDLGRLKELTGLQNLWLDHTQVLDLRPLRGLHQLASRPIFGGLNFQGIPATADPKIAEIAEIEDPKVRAKALFDLLDAGWVPPVAVEPVSLEPDPLLRSILIDGKLEIAPDPPTEQERRDQVKAVLHERLKDKARDLSVLAGNRFPRLTNRARALMLLLDRPFAELDLLSVHLEIEDLEERRTTGAEDGEPYTDDVRNAVSDVTRAGPGLTVGHPDVDTFLDRRRRSREDVVPEKDDAAHQKLSQAVIDDAAANGPNSRAMEELLHRVADQAAARALREAKHRNLIRTLVVPAVSVPRDVAINVAATLIATAYGPAITAFVTSNYGLLSDVAATYGQGVLVWFQQNVGPLMAGIDTTVVRPVERPKREDR